ncbi:molybdenum ABC transporter substrate-binding protein [[Pantoea] beijingensis]|uniref:Molybdenum ABC transporter substrate-binding protein n=1 Tax=[Pantoea] beijingensis TaxID=1324864 RepID=A0A443IBS8_9GAMM|nr:substrate-binding domain-containing protein [[Pantoea] beijingensis]RWR01648.1 molybdenum ABC transporter substrate-binding protein [[Pantoea] beijingensis]
METIRVLAAGSLRLVWPDILTAFAQLSAQPVTTAFGPAGLLRQRIELAESCDLFVSANVTHPQTLLDTGKALSVMIFSHNQLCLTMSQRLAQQQRTWIDLLSDPALQVATSTPISDPSGDYTWALFNHIEKNHPEAGKALKQRARALVGGADSLVVPEGELAAEWIIRQQLADIFIGYQSYALRLCNCDNIAVMEIPASYQIRANYAFAVCHPRAQLLASFLVSERAQSILEREGFIPLNR